MAGRIRSFSGPETETLRTLARKLKDDNDWSSKRLGQAMGIAQQNAARFVAANSTSSIDRTTANALALACGFRDVEHALLDAGTMAELTAAPAAGNQWARRDQAQRIARAVPYAEAAINAVLHRYTGDEHRLKPVRWWMDRIALESIQRAADETTDEDTTTTKRSGTEG